jgi:hypothetical protein
MPRQKTPEKQLDEMIARFTPEIANLARGALAKMHKRLPGALQLVYDNYNALAIGFSPTERASHGIFSIAIWPRKVRLFFLKGKGLPDPHRLLEGSGNVVRSITLEDASDLDNPALQELMKRALERADPPLDETPTELIVIKSIAPTQRPRRPAK